MTPELEKELSDLPEQQQALVLEAGESLVLALEVVTEQGPLSTEGASLWAKLLATGGRRCLDNLPDAARGLRSLVEVCTRVADEWSPPVQGQPMRKMHAQAPILIVCPACEVDGHPWPCTSVDTCPKCRAWAQQSAETEQLSALDKAVDALAPVEAVNAGEHASPEAFEAQRAGFLAARQAVIDAAKALRAARASKPEGAQKVEG